MFKDSFVYKRGDDHNPKIYEGSWLEMGHATTFQPSDLSFLNSALKLRIKAQESSLMQNIEIPHPVANVLLNSIDMDEKKHEKILGSFCTC